VGKTIWINTGELSGDMQAASVLDALRELDPSVNAIGMGGCYLAAAGQKNIFSVDMLSVMGGAEILTAIPRALRLLRGIRKELVARRPDVVLLVDAPEFNFRVARIATELRIPVCYFIPPKVWAWRTGRVRFLRRYVRRLFCILPFEETFYREHGIAVDYVGNPLVERVGRERLLTISPDMRRVGVLPGSRLKEVRSLTPLFGETARCLLTRFPELSFHCLRAPNMDGALIRKLWPADIPLHMEEPEDRYAFMRGCGCIMAASGTATLETALIGTPTAVAYKISPVSAFLARRLIKVRWVSLPNLILGDEVFPEFIQEKARAQSIAAAMGRWLSDPAEYRRVCARLGEVARRCGGEGSAKRAAHLLLEEMSGLSTMSAEAR